MGKCPNCGRKSLLLVKNNCLVCGKEQYGDCGVPLCACDISKDDGGYEYWPLRACSEGCWNGFVEEMKAFIDKNVTYHQDAEDDPSVCPATCFPTDEDFLKTFSLHYLKEKEKNHELLSWRAKGCLRRIDRQGRNWNLAKDKDHSRVFQEFKNHLDPIESRIVNEESEKWWRRRENGLVEGAKRAERVGRYEDAAHNYEEIADHYERYEQYEKAKELRDRARQLQGKGRQVVHVDLNELIQQVRDGGIVAVYRCPRCGGKLKIGGDTRAESLTVCEHCGSEIEAMDLADFIRTALS